jgi:hypothetical protein
MPATTIRLEADLVRKVMASKQSDQSVPGYVRELIEIEHHARESRTAAIAYQQFLAKNPDERAAMECWESAG